MRATLSVQVNLNYCLIRNFFKILSIFRLFNFNCVNLKFRTKIVKQTLLQLDRSTMCRCSPPRGDKILIMMRDPALSPLAGDPLARLHLVGLATQRQSEATLRLATGNPLEGFLPMTEHLQLKFLPCNVLNRQLSLLFRVNEDSSMHFAIENFSNYY